MVECRWGHGREDGLLGCTPQVFRACTCPASRLKKEPSVSNRDISGLMNGGSLHVWSRILEQHPTSSQLTGHGAVFAPQGGGGEGEIASYIDRNRHQVGSSVTRETSRGARPSLSQTWDKYVGRPVMWVACRWSRYWLGWDYTESKRVAILRGLIIQGLKENFRILSQVDWNSRQNQDLGGRIIT